MPYGRGVANIQQQLKAFTVKAKGFPYKKYKTTFTYYEGKPIGWDIASSQYKFVEHPVKPEKIITIKAGKMLKVKLPVVSKTVQKTWIDHSGVIDWAKPSKWYEIRAHQYDMFTKPKPKETKIDKAHWNKIIRNLNQLQRKIATETRAEKVSLFKKKVSSHITNIQNFMTAKAMSKIIKPVKYTPTIPETSTIFLSEFMPKVGTFGLVKLGEKLGESFAEQYRSREKQEYKAKEKEKLKHKYKAILKPKQVYVPKETYKLKQKLIQKVKQVPRQVAKQKYVYDLGFRYPTPTPTTWKIIDIKVPEPEVPPPPPLFKWPRAKLLPKTRKKKKFKPFHKYQPSLVAGFKKITAPKIPKIITGLGIRPVVRL